MVECIERGELDTPQTKALIRQYCLPLLADGADTIVLGCTHYPFVKDAIREIVGAEISLIDTGTAVAMQLKRQLEEKGLLSTSQEKLASHQKPKVDFWTNSEAGNARHVIESLWGKSAEVNML